MGNVHQVEVLVHVDDALSDGQRSDLVGHLKGCDGVEDARFTPRPQSPDVGCYIPPLGKSACRELSAIWLGRERVQHW